MSSTVLELPLPEERATGAASAIDAVRDKVRALRSDTLSYSAMAREAGLGESTFNAWLNGNYAGDHAKIAEKVTRWLDNRAEVQRTRSVLPKAPSFVLTPTVEQLLALLTYAQAVPTMAVVSGGAGIGKTSAIRHYQANNPNVFVMTGEPSVKSPFAVLSYLGEVLGVTERANDRRARATVDRLQGTGALLIVDEAHHYPTKVLDQLRYVFDQAEIGLALIGNAGIYARLEGESRSAQFAPLFRRIGMRLTLLRPEAGDVAALLDAWNVRDRDVRKVCADVAGKPGALGGLTMTLRMAYVIAGAEPVGEAHIRAAYRRLTETSV